MAKLKKKKARPVAKKKVAAKKRPAAKKPAAGKKPSPKPARAVAQPTAVLSPVPTAWLTDAEGRERALDTLGSWVVSTLQAAQNDLAVRQTLHAAIAAFYDIRASANQPRGEFAGHFFIVDAVGLGDSNRPVPWQVLAETVSQERLNRFSEIFDEVQGIVS